MKKKYSSYLTTKKNILNYLLSKYYVFIFLLLFFCKNVNAQLINIPNPSFENYTSCPNNFSQFDRVNNWSQTTFGTPDYFNSCNYLPQPSFSNTSVTASDGNGFAGIFTDSPGSDYKEYITNTLSVPMIAGTTYSISFDMRSIRGSSFNNVAVPINFRGYFGVLFSVLKPTAADTALGFNGSFDDTFLPLNRTYIDANNPVYTDPSKWHRVTLLYKAQGGEKFMTVGQFKINDLANRSNYFVVDNFSPITQVIEANDLVINCPQTGINLNTSITNGPAPSGTEVRWYTDLNHTNLVSNPLAAPVGTYYGFLYYTAQGIFSAPTKIEVTSVGFPCSAYCVKPPNLGTPDGYTKFGISVMQSPNTQLWPRSIPNGFISLDSKTKGFVITRVANEASIVDPKEGMLMYDISSNCVKLYNGTVWNCIQRSCNE